MGLTWNRPEAFRQMPLSHGISSFVFCFNEYVPEALAHSQDIAYQHFIQRLNKGSQNYTFLLRSILIPSQRLFIRHSVEYLSILDTSSHYLSDSFQN